TRTPPALFAPDDRVRFEPTRDALAGPVRAVPAASGPAALEVLDRGLLTTVQDRGRTGFRRLGVSGAGALDPAAAARANAVLANALDEAVVGGPGGGPTLRCLG